MNIKTDHNFQRLRRRSLKAINKCPCSKFWEVQVNLQRISVVFCLWTFKDRKWTCLTNILKSATKIAEYCYYRALIMKNEPMLYDLAN